MTTREHLKAFHTAAAEHHTTMAKSHRKLATHYAKADMDCHQTLADEHNKMSDSHASMAENHLQMCKSVGDSMEKAAGDRLVPDQVRSVYPNLTPVTRKGQPSMAGAEKPNVPVEFEKLVSVEDDL